jgi:putative glutamine amidotransferase
MSKPLIGITPDFNPGGTQEAGDSEATVFLRNRYASAVEAAGAVPVILPIVGRRTLCAALLDHLDGLVLTGSGPDIDPRRYGERKQFSFTVMSRERMDSELLLVTEARKRDLPVLGSCGGMQLMNVALGGTLLQDIGKQIAGALPHRMTEPATEMCHPVTVKPESRLHHILGRSSLAVNSSHHQAVKAVPRTLAVSAVAPDGVIEALEDSTQRFFLGVQWHPEYLYPRHVAHRALFEALVAAARHNHDEKSEPLALPGRARGAGASEPLPRGVRAPAER